MGLSTDEETVAKYFRLNLERGIAHLCGTGFIKSLDDLVKLAVK
jgi:DNA sulfur modification protein DndE